MRRLVVLVGVSALVGMAVVGGVGCGGGSDSSTGRTYRDAAGNTCDEGDAHFGDEWPKSGLDVNAVWCPASYYALLRGTAPPPPSVADKTRPSGTSGATPAAGSAGSGQARWVMTDLGTLGGDFSTAIDLNERGQVVGTSRTASRKHRVFLWEKGRMLDLGSVPEEVVVPNVLLNERGQVVWSPNGRDSVMWEDGIVRKLGLRANAINDRGQIVGQRGTGAAEQVVLWENGRTRELRPPGGGKWSEAMAINNRGQVVVWSTTKKDAERSFLWQNGRWTNIGRPYACAINERGQIVGHFFLWQNGRVTTHNLKPAPGDYASYCFPWAINNRGQIIGLTDPAATEPENWRQRASLWENGMTTILGRAGGAGAIPRRSTTEVGSLGRPAHPRVYATRSSGRTGS